MGPKKKARTSMSSGSSGDHVSQNIDAIEIEKMDDAKDTMNWNNAFCEQAMHAWETVQNHDLFRGIVAELPASIGKGGCQRPFAQKGPGCHFFRTGC